MSDSAVDVAEADRAGARVTSERLAAWVFGAYALIALPVVVFGLGRYHWFLGDDWDFLSDRTLRDIPSLFRPHAEHWSTVPVVVYRLEWRLFGLHYAPYQALTMALHLSTAVLLRVVMRRAGVDPWIATTAAAIFVLFGPGDQNMLWSFQIGMVFSLVFGLLHLMLAGRDGGFARLDAVGLAAGLLGLMSSGIGPVMVGVVGLSVLARRGWRLAILHTVPIALPFAVWFLATADERPRSPSRTTVGDIVGWFRTGVPGLAQALGHFDVVGAALAVILVVGLGLAWASGRAEAGRIGALRRLAEPTALLAGYVAFNLATANSRSAFGSGVSLSSRYIHVGAVFVLPALAVAADALVRRWRQALVPVLVLLLVPIPFNIVDITDLGAPRFTEVYFRHRRQLVEGMAMSDLARQVPADSRPIRDILGGRGPSVGWLVRADDAGRVPDPGPLPPETELEVRLRLAVGQGGEPTEAQLAALTCRTDTGPLEMLPRKGSVVVLGSDVAIRLGEPGPHRSVTVTYFRLNGSLIRFHLDDLELTVVPAGSASEFTLCS